MNLKGFLYKQAKNFGEVCYHTCNFTQIRCGLTVSPQGSFPNGRAIEVLTILIFGV